MKNSTICSHQNESLFRNVISVWRWTIADAWLFSIAVGLATKSRIVFVVATVWKTIDGHLKWAAMPSRKSLYVHPKMNRSNFCPLFSKDLVTGSSNASWADWAFILRELIASERVLTCRSEFFIFADTSFRKSFRRTLLSVKCSSWKFGVGLMDVLDEHIDTSVTWKIEEIVEHLQLNLNLC